MRTPSDVLPAELEQLLRAGDLAGRDRAWEAVVGAHSALILRVTHSVLQRRDDAMDAYVFVLEQLRQDDYRRIRAYGADGRCKFTTWLVVVARRACIDFARHKYGRRNERNGKKAPHDDGVRRQLANELNAVVDPGSIPDGDASHPDAVVRTRELTQILETALVELPVEDRLLLKLRFNDELPASQIAKLLALPSPFHVYRRLNVLFAALRGKLASRGVDESMP